VFAKESVRHVMIEDYSAAASIDLEHDQEDVNRGHRMRCPVQVLCTASYFGASSPVDIWRNWCECIERAAIESGQLIAEEALDTVFEAAWPLLKRCTATSLNQMLTR
jgi:haloacetate dehalogenase